MTETVAAGSRKGEKTRHRIAAIAALAERVEVMGISVRRLRQHANKYAEAEALIAWYPELEPWRPTREKLWLSNGIQSGPPIGVEKGPPFRAFFRAALTGPEP